MRKIMPYSSPPFHQLYLFLIYFHYSSIRIGRTIVTNYKTIRQRGNLKIIPYTRHRSSLRNNVFKIP